jgi:hypothetical protein
MSQDLDQQVRQAVVDFLRQAPRRYPFFSILLGIIILILIIWYIPQWQVPTSGLSLKDRLHQINENRKTVAQIVGGVFILVGLYIAWVRSKAMRDQAEVDREQQLTDLYVKAIEQLGSEKLQIRLGGIYALERIARESPKDHWPIMEVLTAFVRENAPLKDEVPAEEAGVEGSSPTPDFPEKTEPKPHPPREKPPTDIQAVITVLARTAVYYGRDMETWSLDLRGTNLAGVNLKDGSLKEADLTGTNLQGASLVGTNLQGAFLAFAKLHEAHLFRAEFQWAVLLEADLQGADLSEANLQGAFLHEANLKEACLNGTILQGANFQEAKGLTPEQVAKAIWDETTQWPEGFSPPPRRQKEEEKE